MVQNTNTFVSIKSVNNKLSEIVSALQETKDFVGASISVRCSSNYYFNKVLGNLENENRQTGFNDKFLVYSLTKTFTAVAILKLVEEGLFELDTPVENLLKNTHLNKSVTVRALLNHTSGLNDYGPEESYHKAVKNNPSKAWNRTQFEELIKNDSERKWHYSNIGYMYLKLLLENQTSLSYKEAIKRIISAPLYLENTAVVETVEDLQPLVSSHSKELSKDDGAIDIRGIYDPNWCAPGLISSTAQDIAKFYGTIIDTSYFNDDLKQELLKPIKVPVKHDAFKTPSYGMGLMIDPDNSLGLIAGHGGNGPGYTATCFVRVKENADSICASILANSEMGQSLESFSIDLLRSLG